MPPPPRASDAERLLLPLQRAAQIFRQPPEETYPALLGQFLWSNPNEWQEEDFATFLRDPLRCFLPTGHVLEPTLAKISCSRYDEDNHEYHYLCHFQAVEGRQKDAPPSFYKEVWVPRTQLLCNDTHAKILAKYLKKKSSTTEAASESSHSSRKRKAEERSERSESLPQHMDLD